MSVRNYDRHGMENLKVEGVKPLDRLKIPPWVIYSFFFSIFAMLSFKAYTNEEYDLQQLSRRNMLLAMKKQ